MVKSLTPTLRELPRYIKIICPTVAAIEKKSQRSFFVINSKGRLTSMAHSLKGRLMLSPRRPAQHIAMCSNCPRNDFAPSAEQARVGHLSRTLIHMSM